ncbi:MAG: glycosyltransferase family 2 protein [Candidatus Dojkabacteria bacterium]|nr:glycosyltransferase family 2 protein [Candidatus Dojkabacteria bacterium]
MKISIITTNYNTDKYLEDTIRSVLSQKGDFELEYIITDGGSTDNSLNIIKKYKDRLKYISEKDKGQSDGINKGLKMATGDIVAFLNADDLYTEGALDRVVTYFKENPDCMWLTGYCRIINDNDKEIKTYVTRYKNSKLRKFTFEQLLIENCISQPATFWRRKLLDEVGYIDESLHYSMDQDLWARFAKKYRLHLIKEYIACFRFTPDTKTGSSVEKTLRESRVIAEKYSESNALLFRQSISNLKRVLIYKSNQLVGKIKHI